MPVRLTRGTRPPDLFHFSDSTLSGLKTGLPPVSVMVQMNRCIEFHKYAKLVAANLCCVFWYERNSDEAQCAKRVLEISSQSFFVLPRIS